MGIEEKCYDVVVAGGGLAGVCAAIAAARADASVALIQNRPVLGGNSSSEVRVWVCGATATGHQRYARETGIVGELYLENEFVNPLGNPVYWDLVLLEAVGREDNLDLFLNTHVHDVTVQGGSIESVAAHVLGSERDLQISAQFFIDCTGDGSLSAMAGAETMLGREASSTFSESWAPEVADDITLGSTILFYTKQESEPVPFVAPKLAIDVTQTSILESRILRTGDSGADYWWIEWGGELDIVHDNERIRDELWAVIYGIWDYIKNSGEFDADNLTLEWVGSVPGKREYRRIVGESTMTQADVDTNRRKRDAVGFGGWSIDLHPPKGVYEPRGAAQQIYPDGIYDIPLGILTSRSVHNLLMAGRNVSASHVAFGSLRVMATCGVMGEAAGTAAALALENGHDLAAVRSDVGALQQRLILNDASLVGVAWADPTDLARNASITSSSTLKADDRSVSQYPVALASDVAALFPQAPETTRVSLGLVTSEPTSVSYRIHETGDPMVFVPRRELAHGTIDVSPGGIDWAEIKLPGTAKDRNLVVVLEANDVVAWATRDSYIFGQLAMSRSDAAVRPEIDAHLETSVANHVVEWDIKKLNRTTLALAVDESSAYSPERVASAYSRPYGGPHLWMSEPFGTAPEWLEFEWPQPVDIKQVRLIFNDDVNQYANNLHYKRWPFRVVPDLVASYDLQVWRSGNWETVTTVTENRVRHRIHDLEQRQVSRMRLVIYATNGSPNAQVISVRILGQEA